MTDWKQLHGSFEAFEKILEDFARNSDRHDADWRYRLVELRRQLQERLIGMRTALQAHVSHAGVTETSRTLDAALSTIRTAIALHQAEWPAVAIDTANEGYRTSVRELRNATKEFRETAAHAVAALRP